MDTKTWGWVKVIGGLLALYFAWISGPIGMNMAGAVAILALLTLAGGAMKAMAKK